MEFARAQPQNVKNLRTQLQERFPSDLQMYVDVPTEKIDIEEFQDLAVERVKLFRVIENANARIDRDVSLKETIINELNRQNCKVFLPLIKGYADGETRRKDYLSHFICRLAYCRSEGLRKWFLAREMEFFKLKYANLETKEDILLFMKKNNLLYSPITDEEKKSLASELLNSTNKHVVLDTTSFYKVKFTEVLDLVRRRNIFMKSGFGYVPHQDLVSIIISQFRSKLSHALSICFANISSLESDERLARILGGLHTSYTGSDYSLKIAKDAVPIGALDALSKTSFPLCMRVMHENFKKTHHLKHSARGQYGLFLKGIGVSLEDSLRFWREGFQIDPDNFQKKYAYNIRHSYGKEGRQKDYTPQNCMRIIMASVGPGEDHGCPFRHFDANNLRQRLQSYNVSASDISDILDYVTRSHYQLACTKYFEVTHHVKNAKGVNHPNEYFEESQNVINGRNEKKEPVTKKAKIVDDWGNDSELNLDLTAIIEEATQ